MRGSFMLFLVIFLAIIGSAAFYMASRTAFVFGCGRWWFFAGYFILAFVSLAAMMVVRKLYPTLHPFLVILSTLVGVLLYMLIILLLTDAVNIFAHFSPKKYGLIVAISTILISVYGILNTSFPRLKTVEIDIPKLTKPVQIAQLSDVHIGHFRGERNLRRIVQIVNQTEAQMVVITGDMFESFYNLNHETLRPLAELKVPIFFVSGNHDMYVNVDSVKQLMRDAGVNVLENSMTECCGIQIVGLDYMRPDDHTPDHMHAGVGIRTIENTLPNIALDSTKPTILLHHNPVGAEYAEKAGIDLYLAGHTHGGQLFPITILNDHIFNFNRGLYRHGNLQIYTSEGSGTFGPPMRVGTRSEVTLIKLK